MSKIIVNRSGAQHFSPNPYPESGAVDRRAKIKFSSADDQSIKFYAEAGLFFLDGDSGAKNTGSTELKAPAKGKAPLELYVAYNPKHGDAAFRLSLSPITASPHNDVTTGDDGMINVGAHRKEPPLLAEVQMPGLPPAASPLATPAASSD